MRPRKQRFLVPQKGVWERRASGSNYRAQTSKAAGTLTGQDLERQHYIQRGLCFHCNQSLNVTCGRCFEVDHLEPFHRGGLNIPENVVIACTSCNRKKGQMPLYRWVLTCAAKGHRHQLANKFPYLPVQLLLPFVEEKQQQIVA